MNECIIKTKILRPPLRGIIHRNRLYRDLDRGAECKVTLISAPAGYGKTTLMAAWIAETPRAYCWLSLDKFDDSAGRFLHYLKAALLEAGIIDASIGAEANLPEIINQITVFDGDTFIVLDDYHLADSPEIHDITGQLIDRLPEDCHLIIVSRSDPLLRLAKLRGQGEITEIRAQDLQFTEKEVEVFLRSVLGDSFDKKEITALTRHTEGWIAGLQMIATSLRGSADVSFFIRKLTGHERMLTDYLIEEVFDQLQSDIQDFLLECSILDRFSAELCDAVRGGTDSAEYLDSIDRGNLFITALDEERRWYRLHYLFSEMLKHRISQKNPEKVSSLHSAAAGWFYSQGQFREAIDHTLAAEEYHNAISLLEKHCDWFLMKGEIKPVLGWVSLIPEALVDENPYIGAFHAWSALVSGQPIKLVMRKLEVLSRKRQESIVQCLHAYIAVVRGNASKALQLSRMARSSIPESHKFLKGFTLLTEALATPSPGSSLPDIESLEDAFESSLESGNLLVGVLALAYQGQVFLSRGNLSLAEERFQRAIGLAVEKDGKKIPISGAGLLGIGEVNRLRGNVDTAIQCFQDGIQAYGGWFEPASIEGYVGLAFSLFSKGCGEESERAIVEATRLARQFDATERDDRFVALQKLKLVMLNQAGTTSVDTVLSDNIPTIRANQSCSDVQLTILETLVLARHKLHEGCPDECIELAAKAEKAALSADHQLLVLDTQLLLTRAYWRNDEPSRAFEILEKAIGFARPEGIIQPFVDEGEEMARILYEARAAARATARATARASAGATAHTVESTTKFIGRLLAAFPLPNQSLVVADDDHTNGVDALSARELEVLSLLSEGLSNKEAAARLFVSVRTIKWHASNIYAKLNVASRTQALARAKQVGIL